MYTDECNRSGDGRKQFTHGRRSVVSADRGGVAAQMPVHVVSRERVVPDCTATVSELIYLCAVS